MTSARYNYMEVVWWLVLMTVAGWLALVMLNSPARGTPPTAVPIDDEAPARMVWEGAIADYRCGAFESAAAGFDLAACELTAREADSPYGDDALEVWTALELQARGRLSEAADAWEVIALPASTEVYRHIARAAAYLELGALDHAQEAVFAAMHEEPGLGLVHYYVALLRLEQAAAAHRWHAEPLPAGIVRVSHRPPTDWAYTADLYELMAIGALEQAIAGASELRPELRLIEPTRTEWVALAPTVDDLLVALGAEAYLPNAHHTLGYLLLERGQAEAAEEHLDRAVALGTSTVYGYEDLGAYYEALGRWGDATRAFTKSLRANPAEHGAANRVLKNLLQSIRSTWLR